MLFRTILTTLYIIVAVALYATAQSQLAEYGFAGGTREPSQVVYILNLGVALCALASSYFIYKASRKRAVWNLIALVGALGVLYFLTF